ncbi:hypothetical protein CLI64_24690 [Nostoc sp. CENA543]|uniref:hypothetical protein n=1 Tax=Nostoc sp. CENA543 TaxID=1869241 RepID=UPI000CA1B66B|nr:hypothetical protein [Nostoc sp. CENA543]AUT03356.1 hypothetical protein CLI64_24690 [Nostoc sp. CENA543]
MNKLIIAISVISTLVISGCNVEINHNVQATPSTQATPETTPSPTQESSTPENTVTASETPESGEPNDSPTEAENSQPEVGTVKELVNGDLKCYVTLIDENGTEHNVGATFEICAEESQFLNQKVRATYEVVKVNDCQSVEPCGKTRDESLITKMEILDNSSDNESENQ